MANLDVSIIIQGPISYCQEVISSYAGVKNVLWCTWEDESKEGISIIENSGIYVHLIEKPRSSGYWNINFQCKSTYEGLLKSKELFNTTYYLKIRSDFKISDVALLTERFILKEENINFIGWANVLEGFFLDYIVFGTFENMRDYWKFNDNNNNGYPCPEIYLMKKFYGDNCDLQRCKSEGCSKFPSLNGIRINWLSRDGINIRGYSPSLDFNCSDERFYYYFKFKILEFKIKIKNFLNYLIN
jgi:hypothetical protein